MNTWIKLSGANVWHRLPRSSFHAALCGNPSTGIVLVKTTNEIDPPGPRCPKCDREVLS